MPGSTKNFVLVLLVVAVTVAWCGAQQNPADQLIEVLQANPALVNELRTKLPAVNGRTPSDTEIMQQIRTSPEVRDRVAAELLSRGYLTSSPGESKLGASSVKSNPAPAPIAPRKSAERPQPVSRGTPYENMPALSDLNRQVPAEPLNLERFGIAFFRNQSGVSDSGGTDLPVGPDYVLGAGDTINISVWGGPAQSVSRTIDRAGAISLPDAGTLTLAGHTLAEAQRLILEVMRQVYRGINLDVSLGRVRAVRVYVVGDVQRPGAYDVSALSTIITALQAAGGPTAEGSVRVVRHYRGNRFLGETDLYDLILKGVRANGRRLEAGDSILVPPAGEQVSISGMVRRPARYELRDETTLAQVVDLAGGVLNTGTLRNIRVEHVQAHERRVMLSIDGTDEAQIRSALATFRVEDGDQVTISPVLPYAERSIYLEGHVFRPGKLAYQEGMRLTDVIRGYEDLLPEPARRAELVRLRPPQDKPVVLEFDLEDLLSGKAEDLRLQPFDTIRIYGRYEADAPRVAIYGEVVRPGHYPLSEGMTINDLVAMAGGYKRSAVRGEADLATYRVVSEDQVVIDHRLVSLPHPALKPGEAVTRTVSLIHVNTMLKPGDTVTIRRKAGWNDIGASIVLKGEVVHPGTYGITDGERLSSVIRRAGGFTSHAYVEGSVLERVQVYEMAEKARQKLIRDIEQQGALMSVSLKTKAEEQKSALESMRTEQERVLADLKNQPASGRMVVQLTRDVASWQNTKDDIELRAGDVLTIPKCPDFIAITGSVYNSSAIHFVPGEKARWYLSQTGGPTELANGKAIFIVHANGVVHGRQSGGPWHGNVLDAILQPGDVIVVPPKIMKKASGAWREVMQAAQMSSGLAIAARLATSF